MMDKLKTLVIHYDDPKNRVKFIKSVKKRYNKYNKWIHSLEEKLPKKLLSKLDHKIKNIEEYSILGLIKEAFNYSKEAVVEFLKTTNSKEFLKTSVTILLYFMVPYCNRTLLKYIGRYFGYRFELLYGAMIVGPIVEETYKFLTIKLNRTGLGWLLFNIGEFRYYINLTGGFSLENIPNMIIRLVCVLAHTLYTKLLTDKDTPRGLNVILHFFSNSPFYSNLIHFFSEIGYIKFGELGSLFMSVGSMLIIQKYIMSLISKYKKWKLKNKTSDSFVTEPIPQVA